MCKDPRIQRDEMDESAGSGTARTEDGSRRMVGRRKNANKIITLRKRRGMLYVGLDVHNSADHKFVQSGAAFLWANLSMSSLNLTVR